MTGSRFARMARLTALVLAVPVPLGAAPLPTTTRVVSSAVDHYVNHGAARGIGRGPDHGVRDGVDHDIDRRLNRNVAHFAAGSAASIARDTIVIAARDLPRGTVLGAADIERVVTGGENVTSAPATSADSVNDLPTAGWVVRRLVHKGEPLRAPAVAPPVLIAAGSPVSLVWEVGELRVTRSGIAVGAAYAGETVTVRVDARRRFTGIATAPGTVVVRQP